jgi:hypothetical protein
MTHLDVRIAASRLRKVLGMGDRTVLLPNAIAEPTGVGADASGGSGRHAKRVAIVHAILALFLLIAPTVLPLVEN